MSDASSRPKGPDLVAGVPADSLREGIPLFGLVEGEPVILVRRGADVFAIGASCTHYGGPLAEGLVVGESVRCPWHHACFDLRTGEPVRAPALKSLPRFSTEVRDGLAFVTAEAPAPEFPDRSRSVGVAADSKTP